MKRIIVACDGTGQSASRGGHSISTNVNRICHALLNSHESPIQQVVFYQSGIGTADLGIGWDVGKLVQGAVGEGLEENVADAYTFVMNNYLPGDEIFIFGFSRGAFTARVLANIIARVGIFRKPSYTWGFKKAMAAYKAGTLDQFLVELEGHKELDKKYWKKEKGPLVPRVYQAEVKVVGCWDTVASLGFPLRPITNSGGVAGEYEHFDGSLVKGIRHAFHALALDECRGPFTPTMWYLPNDESANSIDLQQCWFPGAHSNVGGGYPDQAIADLTLGWMIDLCRPFLDFNEEYLELIIDLNLHPEKIKSKDRATHGEHDMTYQGYGCGKVYDSYKRGQTWSWKYRTPGVYADSGKGRTNETIHPCVRARWDISRQEGHTKWAPNALEGFEPREINGAWEWAKKIEGGGGWFSKKQPSKELAIVESAFPARPVCVEGGNYASSEPKASLEVRLRRDH